MLALQATGVVFLTYLLVCLLHFSIVRMKNVRLYKESQSIINKITLHEIKLCENQDAHFIEDRIATFPPHAREMYLQRYEKILSILESLKDKQQSWKHILDVGCGDGYLTARIFSILPGSTPPIVAAVDIAIKRLQLLKKRTMNVCGICANAEELPIESQSIDLVICIENIEHLLHPDKAVSEFYRVLKPGGHCLVSFPSRHVASLHVWNLISWLEFIVGLKYDKILVPFHNLYEGRRKNPSLHRAFTITDTKKMFKGFQEVSLLTHGIAFPFAAFLPSKILGVIANIFIVPRWLGQTIMFVGGKSHAKK